MKLWLDAFAFGGAVLNRNGDPWAAPSQLGAMLKDLERLLPCDVIVTPFDALFHTWLPRAADPAHNAEALDRLVGKAAFQDAINVGLASIRAAKLQAPVALAFPGPSLLLGAAEPMTFENADLVFSALCALVRQCGSDGVHAVLVEEHDADALEPADALANVADHLNIMAALRTPHETAAVTAIFARQFSPGASTPWLTANWVMGNADPPRASEQLVSVPPNCPPEHARSRVRALKAAG